MKILIKIIGVLVFISGSAVYAQNYADIIENANLSDVIDDEAGYNQPENRPNLQVKKKRKTVRDEAFDQLINKTIPLTPDQIKTLHKKLDESQQAVATPVGPPPTPVFSNLVVKLEPGATPPVVRLAAGFVSSVVFLDSTGQPWPIGDFSLGNPKDFNIQWDNKTNTLFLQSITSYVTGNLAVRLAGLDTPIMVSMVTGQKEVDYRVDLQVRARGPNAAPVIHEALPNSVNSNLYSVLDGVPPSDSIELGVVGGEGRAWMVKDRVIFRSKLTLLSPAWGAHVSSLDGTHVYEISHTPLLLASHNGKTIKINLTGI